MQTHDDFMHYQREQQRQKKPFDINRLRERADDAMRANASRITADPNEQPVAEWQHKNGVWVQRRVDDEQGILRVSIGGGIPDFPSDYCVYRGDSDACIALMTRAIEAIQERR